MIICDMVKNKPGEFSLKLLPKGRKCLSIQIDIRSLGVKSTDLELDYGQVFLHRSKRKFTATVLKILYFLKTTDNP